MKTIKKISFLMLLVLVIQSCKKNETPQNPDVNAAHQKDIDKLQSFFDKNKTKKTTFTIDPAVGGIFTAGSGAKLYIKPNAFKRKDGTFPTGLVKLEYTDVLDIDNMIFYDKPTVTNTNQQLISYCEIFISATEGSNLLIPSNSVINPIVATVPTTTPLAFSTDTFNFDIPIWLGDTTLFYQLEGLDYEARPVSLIRSKLMNKGILWEMAWGRGADFIPKANSIQKDSVSYAIQNFDVWLNCDALNFDPRPKTKLFCYFNDHFNNPDTVFYRMQTSYVYFKPKALNILIKVPNPIFNAIPTKEGFYTNENLSPIGLDGKFIAFSIKDGKYYAEVKTAIVPTPAPGKTYSTLTFNPVEVTEAQLLAMIQSLKGY